MVKRSVRFIVNGKNYLTLVLFSSKTRSKSSTSGVVDLLNNKKFDAVVDSLKSATAKYEDFTGVTDLRNVQLQVLQAERDFVKTEQNRREKQNEIQNLQTRLRDIHLDLDKTSRGDDRYLHLLTQEHAIIKQEKSLMDDLRRLERSERHCFTNFSNRLRESHEKERVRAERTKYVSIIASLVSVTAGLILGTVGHRYKINNIKKSVVEDSAFSDSQMQKNFNELSAMLQNQQRQTTNFVFDLKAMLNENPPISLASSSSIATSDDILRDWMTPQQSLVIKTALEDHNKKLTSEMEVVKTLIASQRGYKINGDGDVVYAGPAEEIQSLLEKTEKNLETKLRLTTLIGVVCVYAALACTIPLFFALFRGAT